MATLSTGPCTLDGWQIQRDMGCWDVPAGTTEEQIEYWRRVAAEYLYMATGQRFGRSCAVTVRPCRKPCADSWAGRLGLWPAGYNGSPWIPYVGRDGLMYNASVCGCTTDCHCGSELCQIELPGPIFDIDTVNINGTVIDSSAYFSYDARFLVLRPDVMEALYPDLGVTCWPDCQDLSAPPGSPNTVSVTYSTGQATPFMGGAAVTELTAHYIKGCAGCGCGISANQNLSRMTRQGVELEFVSAQEAFGDGRTGLELVDRFIKTYNPSGLPRAMRVFSPDHKRPRLWLGY